MARGSGCTAVRRAGGDRVRGGVPSSGGASARRWKRSSSATSSSGSASGCAGRSSRGTGRRHPVGWLYLVGGVLQTVTPRRPPRPRWRKTPLRPPRVDAAHPDGPDGVPPSRGPCTSASACRCRSRCCPTAGCRRRGGARGTSRPRSRRRCSSSRSARLPIPSRTCQPTMVGAAPGRGVVRAVGDQRGALGARHARWVMAALVLRYRRGDEKCAASSSGWSRQPPCHGRGHPLGARRGYADRGAVHNPARTPRDHRRHPAPPAARHPARHRPWDRLRTAVGDRARRLRPARRRALRCRLRTAGRPLALPLRARCRGASNGFLYGQRPTPCVSRSASAAGWADLPRARRDPRGTAPAVSLWSASDEALAASGARDDSTVPLAASGCELVIGLRAGERRCPRPTIACCGCWRTAGRRGAGTRLRRSCSRRASGWSPRARRNGGGCGATCMTASARC